MQEEKIIMFRNRLAKVFRHLGRQAKRLNVSCYRAYDHDLPEFPFCIEVYEDNLYVAEYKRRHGLSTEQHDEWIQKSLGVIQEIFHVKQENIFLKLRKRKAARLGRPTPNPSQREGEPTPNPSQKEGRPTPNPSQREGEFVVHENKLKFIVNLSDRLDTGLFLDHRITREMVQKEAAGKKLLNLFCFTGSFSVYGAAGGAREITSVDLSKTYLNRAMRNMELNGFADEKKYRYINGDVKEYLKTLPPDYFDVIILDPPTFSNSQRMEGFLDIQRDHAELINSCLIGLRNSGVLYFSTNYKKFILDKGKIEAASIKDITKATTPFDFEGRIFRWCFRITK